MIQWWQLHPIIAPLPKGFMDEDKSHKEAKEWMNRATEHIDKLEEALIRISCDCEQNQCYYDHVREHCPHNIAADALYGDK